MSDVLAWLASLPPEARDAEYERTLGLGATDPTQPGPHLIGHHRAGVASIALAVQHARPSPSDVFVDLGAGQGKVLTLVKSLCACQVRGVELQPSLVATALPGTNITLGDARTAPLDDGTLFFLYAPFEGPVLDEVLARLHDVARQHAIVVCALGVNVERPWLHKREGIDSLFLDVLDSVVPGVAPRVPGPAMENPFLDVVAKAVLRSPP
ncbi:MAG: hypothetical protein U0228_09200 [Myxococcaceae bacterium]